MILQFKVSLMGMKPPVWRRLQVDGDMTFYEFHKVLQAAFEWFDYHLHTFMMKKSSGDRLDRIEIGSEENDSWGFNMNDLYDECGEKLSDWFVVEKDRAIYTYDFGDDWEHEIVLEKILPPEDRVLYPRCIKAVRHAPEEDSRGELLEEGFEPGEVDPKELTEEINETLSSLAKPFKESPDHQEGPDVRELFKKAKTFNALKPWEKFDDDDIFVVVDPLTGEKMFCCIMGALQEEFGMAVYIGDEGHQILMKILRDEIDDEFEIVENQRSILLSFENREELHHKDYQLIKANGMSFRGKKQWPQFRSFKPGYYPWMIDQEEARLLKIAIEQAIEVVKAAENGLPIPDMLEEGEVLARVAMKTEGNFVWQTEIIPVDQLEMNKPNDGKQPLFVPEIEIKRLLKYKKYNAPIEIDFFRMDMPIQSRPAERPYFPMMAAALDKRNGLVIFYDILEGQPGTDDYQHTFIKMIKAIEKKPREIWVKTYPRQMLEPLLDKLGIKAIEVERLPQMSEMKELMTEMMGKGPF